MSENTKSPENQRVLELKAEFGIERLGLMSSQAWYDDPRGVLFTLARYKFVAKMLSGKKNVLELGCGDGFYSRLVQQTVEKLTLTDHDPILIADLKSRNPAKWMLDAFVHDMTVSPTENKYDAIYLLDVFEHIAQSLETNFLSNLYESLTDNGIVIVGMPSIESQVYASELSKAGHINCKTGEDLRACLQNHFNNVLMFSMNDEVVHTGFFPMAHYIFSLATGKKPHANV